MENPIQKFRQNFNAFEKPGTLPEKLKTLTSSKSHKVEYFLQKFCISFLRIDVYKRVFEIFIFCFYLELFLKIKKCLVSTHSQN